MPIVTGGTGLYFRALEKGLAQAPEIPYPVTNGGTSRAISMPNCGRDPAMAGRLLASDRQRLVRALEVIEGTGPGAVDCRRTASRTPFSKGPTLSASTWKRRAMSFMRGPSTASTRRSAPGRWEEAQALLAYDPALPVMKAIGVPELTAHLKGEITLDEARSQAKTATRNYIKRQLTWWRGQMGHWRTPSP